MNAADTGQFERTLDRGRGGAYVSYLEAPPQALNQPAPRRRRGARRTTTHGEVFHRAELVRWRRRHGMGGIYNFVTKRGKANARCKILVDAGGDRIRHHLEVPERGPAGRRLGGRVLLMAVINNHQQADTGTKMIHIGQQHEESNIVSRSLRRKGQNSYRGQVKVRRGRTRATTRSATRC
ncbi:MAG: SufD family Fe-S cluster assembly protein [Gemmatimonadetes bacterium]|nr:SufD family Fe-S cluster assembly protein [Gemmatimonadota bacterium]